jgi:protoporphyrinogen oxidase
MDIGPHYVTLPNNSEITKRVINIVGKENIEKLPNNIRNLRKVYFQGKIWNEFPSVNQFLTQLNSKKILRFTTDMIIIKMTKFLNKKNQTSSKEYIISNYGNFLYENWFKPYFHSLFFDKEPEKEMMENKFPPLTIKKIFKSIKLKHKSIDNHDKNNKFNFFNCYFKGGMITFINGLKKEIIKQGGKIETNVDIKSIEHTQNKKITYTKNNKTFEIKADLIIYALPLHFAQKWFDIKPKLNENNEKDFLNSIMIFLFIDSPKVLDEWIVDVYDSDIVFWRVSQQSFLSSSIVPKNKTLLNVEIRVRNESPIWEMSNEKIVEKIKLDLIKMYIIKNEKIENYKVIKLKNLYPINQKSKNSTIKDLINSHKNEYVAGTESDSEKLISSEDVIINKFRMGGILITMSNAQTLVNQIIQKLNNE